MTKPIVDPLEGFPDWMNFLVAARSYRAGMRMMQRNTQRIHTVTQMLQTKSGKGKHKKK